MAFTLTQVDGFLADLVEVYPRAVKAKSYGVNSGGSSRNVTRLDPDAILKQMQYWETYRAGLVSGQQGIQVSYVTPVDI